MISFEDFQKLEIKTATILEAKYHPDADKLLLLSVDSGNGPKQIVAGIKSTYEPSALTGKTIIIIDNLEPAVIRGEKSTAMLLAVGTDKGPVLVVPDKDVPCGAKVK